MTALTLRSIFRLALRQTEGLIGSIIGLLGLDLAVPDHSTLSRRAATLQVIPRPLSGIGPVHLLVDSTGLKLCGPGEWLVEKHGTRTRRSWRKLHIGVDADTGQIMATELTTNDIDDGSRVGPLLDQVAGPITRLLVMGPTTGTMSTMRLPNVIRRPRLLYRHAQPPCRARPRTPRRRSVIGI
jgi:Transposase DDE domain